MDFSLHNSGGIDFSPSPTAEKIILALDNFELIEADAARFERFWRVWHADRKVYAPKLTDLTIVLRPSIVNGCMNLHGINAFLEYYAQNLEPMCKTHGLKVYLDNISEAHRGIRHIFTNAPQLLFSVDGANHC